MKLKLQYFGHLMQRVDSLENTLMLGGIGGRRKRGRQMAGWHHQLDGHEFGSTLGVSDGQGGLVCCDSWGRKETKHDLVTEQQQQQWRQISTRLIRFVMLELI